MDEDTIQDFKQFIAATVSQQISDIRSDIKKMDNKLSAKIDNLSESVAEAIEKMLTNLLTHSSRTMSGALLSLNARLPKHLTPHGKLNIYE